MLGRGLLGQLRAAATIDPASYSDDELLEEALAYEEADAVVAARRYAVLVELEQRNLAVREHGMTTAGWIAREAHSSRAAIAGDLNAARKLSRRLDKVMDALAGGRISRHHVRVIAAACNDRNIDAMVDLQDTLLDVADTTVFDQWRNVVRHVATLVDQDGAFDPGVETERNRLRLSDGLDGLGHLEGSFAAQEWLGVKQAITDRSRQLFRRYREVNRLDPSVAIPTPPCLNALALAELIHEAQGVDLDSTRAPRTEISLILSATTPEPVRAGDATYAGPSSTHAVEAVNDTVERFGDQLRALGVVGNEPFLVDRDGVRLPPELSHMLCCDADLYPIIVNSLGEPINMGSKIRFANRAQRRALAARDGGCACPGCDRPISWLGYHHILEFEDGGPTDIANLVGLCRFHHNIVHRFGWEIFTSDDGWFWFETPSGRTFWAQRHFTRRTDAPPPARRRSAA